MLRTTTAAAMLGAAALALACLAAAPDKPAATGPHAEKRFPPLRLPPGFQATLFACDPMVEYPSVIAAGPRAGTLLVAIDYMTGLGTDITRRDEIRLLEDTDGDGYADRSTVVAAGFNSIQGLAQHNGTMWVMHAPYLTMLRYTKGMGKADERRDLLTGLGLPPEQDQIRLHNANGVVLGHDGWLYLALGDRGCNILRPEGDRLVLEGGGVLRCRPDGRDLHVYSTGLRNIYDVALDEELNVFLRDNENDGGTYGVRICHSFFGADHGYPYLYYERPEEAVPPLFETARGSSAGVVCYLETQFPAEYRGNLLSCEWGRAVVRAERKRLGASFAPTAESDFAAAAPNDPYGFKPTDLVVDRDGSLFVSDWADGQRPRRGRGRIYRIRYAGMGGARAAADPSTENGDVQAAPLERLVARLDSDSYWVRFTAQDEIERRGKQGLAAVLEHLQKGRLASLGRMHAVWIITKLEGRDAVARLFDLAETDPDPRVQAQALRAVADLTDPVLVRHRLDAGRGESATCLRLAAFVGDGTDRTGRDLRVQLEAVLALGRLRWPGTPERLQQRLPKPDIALAHAAAWALRRAGNWPGVLRLIDLPSESPVRAIALRALADQHEEAVADGLLDRLQQEADATRRLELADLLARVHRKPGPWVYWGFQPGPRPANSVAWPRTEAIARALNAALRGFDAARRATLLRRMVREKVPAETATLAACLDGEYEAERVGVILAAMSDPPAAETRPILESVLLDRKHTITHRLQAAALYLQGLTEKDEGRLLAAAQAIEDGPVLAELLRALGTRKVQASGMLLRDKTGSTVAEVRRRAVEALAELGGQAAESSTAKLLHDADAGVRAAAALAVGRLRLAAAADRLLQLAGDPAAEVRSASLTAMRQLGDRRALTAAVDALSRPETASAALAYLAVLGGPEQAAAVTALAQRQPSVEVLTAVGWVLTGWQARKDLSPAATERLRQALAELHGGSGVLLAWRVAEPLSAKEANEHIAQIHAGGEAVSIQHVKDWRTVLSTGMEGRLQLGPAKDAHQVWLAFAEVMLSEPAQIELFTASTGLETIWFNGKVVFQRPRHGTIGLYPDRVDMDLGQGLHRVVVRLSEPRETVEMQLRFRRKSASPELERLAAAALSRAGNPAAGRKLFLNAEKTHCLKCHRLGEAGEHIGPDLTALGSRFSKVYIIESILEPSRSISPSFESILVETKNGELLLGLKLEESDKGLVLADSRGKKHALAKGDIHAYRKSPQSTMPDGLAKELTEEEFVDLVSFLVSLRVQQGR